MQKQEFPAAGCEILYVRRRYLFNDYTELDIQGAEGLITVRVSEPHGEDLTASYDPVDNMRSTA